MPKKTKKEKIIAEYRRKRDDLIRKTIPVNPDYRSTSAAPRQTASPSPFVFQVKTTAASHATVATMPPMDQAIRRDLVKTLILAAVAIGGEVVLSMMIK